jgi:alanine racemase
MACVEELAAEPGGRLLIDLGAVRANHERIAAAVAPARLGAVVKADAYGLGSARIGAALATAGCRDFFVAFLDEALRLKACLPADARLHVLNGLAPGDEPLCAARGVRPVLNSLAQARRWRNTARTFGAALPAALQVDTGMSRLGMAPEEAAALLAEPDFAQGVELTLLMTHLACADTPEDAANQRQLDRFGAVGSRAAPSLPASIANSAASAMAPAFHGDLVRAGLALFGAAPAPGLVGRLRPVVRLDARVIQVRSVEAGAGVGYGLTYTARQTTRLATLAMGYADGWPRRLGGRAAAWFRGVRLPIVGRISMDSMTVDATALPSGALDEGDYVELIGPNATLETVARQAETIPYEILTGLGPRLRRAYVEAAAAQEVKA